MIKLYYSDFLVSQRQLMGVLSLLNRLHWKLPKPEIEKILSEANELLKLDGKIYFDPEKEQYYYK